MTGGAVGQGVLAAAVPLLSRMVSPAEYGVFATSVAASAIVGLVSTLRLELAIPVVASDEEASRVQWSALFFAGLFALVGIVVAVVFRERVFGLSAFGIWPWLFAPLGMLGTAALQVVHQRLTRERNYHLSGLVVGLQPILQVTCQVVLLLAGVSGATALVAGYAASTLCSATFGFLKIHEAYDGGRPRVGVRAVLGVAATYREYPIIYTPAALLNVLVLQAPTVVLASTLGVVEAGTYGMASRLLGAPTSLVIGAYSRVFFAEASASAREQRTALQGVVRSTVVQLLALGALALALGFALAEPVLVPVLGSAWSGVPAVLVALLPLYAGQMVVAPITQVTNVLGRHGVQFASDVARFLVAGSVLALSYGGAFELVEWTWLYSLTSAAMYTLLLLVLLRLSTTHDTRASR